MTMTPQQARRSLRELRAAARDGASLGASERRLRQEAERVLADRAAWIKWLAGYGAGEFYDAFVRTAQDARSKCVYCRALIYLDIVEGGGVPDWRTVNGDYGCRESPDTTDDGTGGHKPEKLA